MFFAAFLDKAVECVKVLVDNNRCVLCDHIDGKRLKYPCGHTFCDDCVKDSHCLFCLTPPNAGELAPSLDDPATCRAQSAANLLKIFEEVFQVDVYKRSRLSEKLKSEKEIFPDPIQAPVKYFNKRKSSLSGKENRRSSVFISPTKMEESLNYVQDWFEKNEKSTDLKYYSPRKPFADLNINTNNQSPLKRGRDDLSLEKARDINQFSAKKKKQSFKSAPAAVDSHAKLDQYWKLKQKDKTFKKIKKDFEEADKQVYQLKTKSDKGESGIVVDDEPIVIDDSQSLLVDKDRLAWLAVLEANEKDPYFSQVSKIKSSAIVNNTNNKGTVYEEKCTQGKVCGKVPFFKKSYLAESCKFCLSSCSHKVHHTETKTIERTKDVCITIESKVFNTTIKVFAEQQKDNLQKQSKTIQTDIADIGIDKESKVENKKATETVLEEVVLQINKPEKGHTNLENHEPIQERIKSLDLFTGEIKAAGEQKRLQDCDHVKSQVVISDSDSDDALDASSTFEVTAEVHRSSDQLEQQVVLAELKESTVPQRPNRRRVRGNTPNSSDSSDKENLDPNRSKRMKLEKKGKKKYVLSPLLIKSGEDY